jgi:Domain of unknown function (DUF4347)
MIIDIVDMTDQRLGEEMIRQLRQRGFGSPILLYGMSNGVAEMVSAIIRRVRRPRTITLLRINGHGAPGVQGIASGEMPDGGIHLADITLGNLDAARPELERLKPYFRPEGVVILLGCAVGMNSRGRHFIQKLADFLEVPVLASDNPGERHATYFDGQIAQARPRARP